MITSFSFVVKVEISLYTQIVRGIFISIFRQHEDGGMWRNASQNPERGLKLSNIIRYRTHMDCRRILWDKMVQHALDDCSNQLFTITHLWHTLLTALESTPQVTFNNKALTYAVYFRATSKVWHVVTHFNPFDELDWKIVVFKLYI